IFLDFFLDIRHGRFVLEIGPLETKQIKILIKALHSSFTITKSQFYTFTRFITFRAVERNSGPGGERNSEAPPPTLRKKFLIFKSEERGLGKRGRSRWA